MELQQNIFSLLPIRVVGQLNLVCRNWKLITEDETFWRHLYMLHFSEFPSRSMNDPPFPHTPQSDLPRPLFLHWKRRCIAASYMILLMSSRKRHLSGLVPVNLWMLINGKTDLMLNDSLIEFGSTVLICKLCIVCGQYKGLATMLSSYVCSLRLCYTP